MKNKCKIYQLLTNLLWININDQALGLLVFCPMSLHIGQVFRWILLDESENTLSTNHNFDRCVPTFYRHFGNFEVRIQNLLVKSKIRIISIRFLKCWNDTVRGFISCSVENVCKKGSAKIAVFYNFPVV